MRYEYKPEGVCPKNIEYEVRDQKIYNVKYTGGCPGNLQALCKVIEGMEVSKAIELFENNTCGPRGTSCADQLAKALRNNNAV